MENENEDQFTKNMKKIFSNMRIAEDCKRQMTLATERLQSLRKIIASSACALEEQQKIILDLEVDEKLAISKVDMWNNVLPLKEILLEDAKKELKKKNDDFFSEREQYCNTLATFVNTGGLITNKIASKIHVLPETIIENRDDVCWNSSISLKKAERDKLKSEIAIWMKKIEEKKEMETGKRRNQFNEELEKAIEAEELRYEKLLDERQTEIKQLTYQIKLKKLRKNQELANEAMSAMQNLSSEPNVQSRLSNMRWSRESKPFILKHTTEMKRKKKTPRSQMRHLFNASRFINASRNL